jgi:hypothetical protein
LRVPWEDNSLNPPCCGHRQVAGDGLGCRRGVVEGGASFLAVGVASGHRRWAPATERRRSARSRITQGRGGGNGLEPLSPGPEADKEVRTRGREGCPGQRISGQIRGLFGSPRWAVCSVRADTFEHKMVVWVGPLKMPS